MCFGEREKSRHLFLLLVEEEQFTIHRSQIAFPKKALLLKTVQRLQGIRFERVHRDRVFGHRHLRLVFNFEHHSLLLVVRAHYESAPSLMAPLFVEEYSPKGVFNVDWFVLFQAGAGCF